MSDKDDAQPESRDRDPWAPPERRVPLDKPAAGPQPPVPPAPHGPVAGAPGMPPAGPGMPPAGAAQGVPPVPLAPTGPGTPSAYPGGPYGYGQGGAPGQPQAPYGPVPGQGPYAQGPYGQTAYGTGAYGYPGPAYGQGWQGARQPDNGLGVAALVLGIVGSVLSITLFFGVICGVLAIIFGAIGRGKVSSGHATNGGQALAGLILGGVALVLTAVMFIVLIASNEQPAPGDDPDDATYGAYMAAPPAPGPFPAFAARS